VTVTQLGRGFSLINKAVGGTTAANWRDDDSGIYNSSTNNQSIPLLTNAMNAFDNAGVELINIMIGTNDAGSTTTGDYKVAMQSLISQLQQHGYKHIFLHSIPFVKTPSTPLVNQRLESYQMVLDELVAENAGFVVRGDTNIWEWSQTNSGSVFREDGVHLNDTGHTKLGEFWANAIRSNFEYQINPAHSFTGTDGSSHTL
jgi:lysophospholipase L1-like esterase